MKLKKNYLDVTRVKRNYIKKKRTRTIEYKENSVYCPLDLRSEIQTHLVACVDLRQPPSREGVLSEPVLPWS